MKSRESFRLLLAVLGLALAGCSDPGVVRFHVVYSTDVKSWIDACT